MQIQESLSSIEEDIRTLSTEEKLKYIYNKFGDKATFSTSLGLEDQVLTYLIFQNAPNIKIFSIDTGRLFEETYSVFNTTRIRYRLNIDSYHPEANEVENLLNQKGPFSFYDSIEDRKECCFIRKVKPLKRALSGNLCWLTGIRKEQSNDRKDMKEVEWDQDNQIIKIHPLLNWTLPEIEDYIQKNNIPINELHKKGFPSIGCAPCTRAIQPGEDVRAGRWWWEQGVKECGLHSHKKGK